LGVPDSPGQKNSREEMYNRGMRSIPSRQEERGRAPKTSTKRSDEELKLIMHAFAVAGKTKGLFETNKNGNKNNVETTKKKTKHKTRRMWKKRFWREKQKTFLDGANTGGRFTIKKPYVKKGTSKRENQKHCL